jgi:hypothetical protein
MHQMRWRRALSAVQPPLGLARPPDRSAAAHIVNWIFADADRFGEFPSLAGHTAQADWVDRSGLAPLPGLATVFIRWLIGGRQLTVRVV